MPLPLLISRILPLPLRIIIFLSIFISVSYCLSGISISGSITNYSLRHRVLLPSSSRRTFLVTSFNKPNVQCCYRSSTQIRLSKNKKDGIREEVDHSMISKTTKVGIVGAGAIAFATASILATNDHDPMIWSPSGKGTLDLSILTSTGAIEYKFQPRIASDVEELIASNSIIMLALPANGHVQVMNDVVPYIRPDQIIIISSHSSLGAIYLTQLLYERGITNVPIIAWGTTIATARKTSPTSVQVCTIRSLVDMCTIPENQTYVGLKICKNLFGDKFKLRDGLLAISLSNLNAQNHLGIALGNMSRMERGEQWSQGLNLTPNIGRLLERLDQERLDIANALALNVRTIYEHFNLSFHVPISSVSEMNQAMVAKGNDVNGPDMANSRYVTEDVPYGLTLIVILGKLVGRPAMLHQAGIQIVSAMYGEDFANANGLLNVLNLEDFSIEDIQKAAKTGLLLTAKCSKNKGVEI